MSAIVISLAAPLLAALVAVALPRMAVLAGAGAAILVLGASIVLAARVLAEGPVGFVPGGWPVPLGIALSADGLAVAFLAMSALVMTAVLASAARDFAPGNGRAAFGFWPLALLLWGAVNAIFLSRDLFNLYVGLELLTLVAVALVALSGKPATLAAAMRYMIWALIGSLLYLLGVVIIYGGHGTLDIALLHGRAPAPADGLALALITAGLAVKTALFPFHVWLPPAHAGAPAPASAMLSALVPKASFLIIVRLWFETMPDIANPQALVLLGALGAAAVVYGGLLAMGQTRLKSIIAYSTVAQIGYLFLIFPLAGGGGGAQPWAAGVWSGTIFHAVSHALAKASMFLSTGLFVRAVGDDAIAALRGLARELPVATFAFGLAAISLMGLPPSGAFTAKYMLLTATFPSGQWWWAIVLLGGGLMAAIYLYRPIEALLAPEPAVVLHRPARWEEWVPLVLALAAILLGLFSAVPFELVHIGRPETAVEGL
ncbi:NADH-quinone oxidoreductase subunit J (plasmid) [Skermanella sp. TT6]|uniref:NADH-quinone oxidoreductase subunit J n=1 Tax=Skermanella cutis TaxID=2775420 RepID=A0ABX7BEL3_9PROT|nr:proton-conducting transporter membrane subunit [Skermanella sp. TT6]QQP92827.1 NADH-quinone oxidoreductase subunit J [Skermanella sp. TT6]